MQWLKVQSPKFHICIAIWSHLQCPAYTGLWYTTLLHELIDNLHLYQKYLYKCLWYQNSLQGADHHICCTRYLEVLYFDRITAHLLCCPAQLHIWYLIHKHDNTISYTNYLTAPTKIIFIDMNSSQILIKGWIIERN